MRILSFNDLRTLKGVSFSREYIRRLERQGRFPKRVPVGSRAVGWIEDEVDE